MKYNAEIVYSKRKTVSITVSDGNKVILRCPIGYSRAMAERFLIDKSSWIDRALSRNERKLNLNADIFAYKNILVNGQKLPLCTGCKRQEITGSGVFVKSLKDLKKLYTYRFAENFKKRLNAISVQSGLQFNGVQIKSFKSRWGSCDGGNNISFNYRIFMLPDHIQYYIIVHELCHTLQHNHSDKFWKLVEVWAPDYKRVKKDLRGYDFLTRLY